MASQTIYALCPQGSVLGPLLAVINLDGLIDITDTQRHSIFADTTSLYAFHTEADTVKLNYPFNTDSIPSTPYSFMHEWH